MNWIKKLYRKLIGLEHVEFSYKLESGLVVRWKTGKTHIYYKRGDSWFNYLLNSKIANPKTIKALNKLNEIITEDKSYSCNY